MASEVSAQVQAGTPYLGSRIALLIQTFMPTHIPLWAPVVGFAISVSLGFGLWPAWKATCLHLIEALRYE